MRVMFCVFPATAHLYPVVPLAWAMQSAGHEVVIAAPESVVDPRLQQNIAAAGLTAVNLGGREALTASLRPFLADVDPANRPTLALDPDDPGSWRQVRRTLSAMFAMYYPPEPAPGERRPIMDDLVDFARAWRPDLVLWDPLAVGGGIAARACGAAHARLLWGTDTIGLIRSRVRAEAAGTEAAPSGTDAGADAAPAEDPWEAWLTPLLARYGLEFTEEQLLGQWNVDLAPARMRHHLPQTHLPVRRVPYTGAAELPSWLHARPDRPRAVLTLGVSRRLLFGRHSGFPMREFFESVAGLDAELVATLNAEQLTDAGPLPDNVRAVEYVPLNQLLPTSSAIIHHGGGGTYCAAVAFQVPQLVVPVPMWDEALTARHVVARGAGLMAPPDTLDADSLHKQLRRLLEEPSFQLGARALYEDSLASPSPADVVPVLERLTVQHRG